MVEGTKNPRWRASEYLALAGLVVAVLSFVFGDLIRKSSDEVSPAAASTVVATTVDANSSTTTGPVPETSTTSSSVPPTPVSTTAPIIRKVARVSSSILKGTYAAGGSISLNGVIDTDHDGTPKFSVSPPSACVLSGKVLSLLAGPKCTVRVFLPQTSRFKSKSVNYPLTVEEVPLDGQTLAQLSNSCCTDAGAEAQSNTYVNHGRAVDIKRTALDLRKPWLFRVRITLPTFLPQGATCTKLYVNYRYSGVFGNTDDSGTTRSCTGDSGTFERCINFRPTVGRSGYPSMSDLPATAVVTLERLYWTLQWSSTPIDYAQRKRENVPIVEVLDVRPGSCT